ncbi:MAG: hypothetical protein IKE03_07845, partial [Blautia sp.]|nr:hypothetical protein [Blautia sp.]
FILYPYVMKDVHGGTVRLHIKNAAALHAAAPGDHSQWEEKKQGQIMPLYRRNEEAVFVLPAVPGRYVLYRIIRE